MEETGTLQELVSSIEQSTRRQARYAKLQCLFSLITAALFAVLLIVVLCFIPRINGILNQTNTILEEAQQVSSQLAQADIEGVMSDLESVANQMAQTDLNGLAQDVSSLVQTTQTSVEEAMSRLNDVDLATLNQAISDLSAVLAPLSSFFSRLK